MHTFDGRQKVGKTAALQGNLVEIHLGLGIYCNSNPGLANDCVHVSCHAVCTHSSRLNSRRPFSTDMKLFVYVGMAGGHCIDDEAAAVASSRIWAEPVLPLVTFLAATTAIENCKEMLASRARPKLRCSPTVLGWNILRVWEFVCSGWAWLLVQQLAPGGALLSNTASAPCLTWLRSFFIEPIIKWATFLLCVPR